MPARVVAASPGSFDAERLRPVGRIGGGARPLAPGPRDALITALGAEASVLDGGQPGQLVADYDACWLGDRPVASTEAFATRRSAEGLREIDGAFALAWVDADGALCLARDPIGERSLFYALTPAGYVFASTVRALLATGLVPRTIDPVGVAQYLACAYVPGERTLVDGIRAVMPGEIVRLTSGGVTRTQYWSPPGETQMLPVSHADQLRQELRERIETAVLRRLNQHERMGCSLSGGLDSSLVVAVARHVSKAPLETFSISFGDKYPNELAWSTMVAEHCGTDHTILEISPAAVVHHMDDVAACFDRPVGDPLSVPNGLLFREATQHVGVLLNGEGGDPCFGGPKNLPMVLAELYGDARNRPGERFQRERTYLRAHERAYDDIAALLTAEARERIAGDVLESELAPLFADPRWGTFVNKLMMMNLVLKAGHHILPKVDALSGSFGVRGRSPLLDRPVVETAFTIPPQLKLHGAVEKYLLKAAVEDLLPRPILDRPKSGMGVPVESWFYGPLRNYAHERLLDGLPKFGIFERTFLERLLSPKTTGLRERRGPKIWLLITLEAWLRRVLAAPPSTDSSAS
ncbi:asparagine synthetase B family protein [Enhygromyxa salina]|uniref:asparagine synthase (glutamine-hydrolyzing) n=1 Tax=Enhygromyxa salina TaxID=215803 RepID=A0A2S9YDJ5_9BACT|nr:asparagine synthase-related protein [Enhygromyxa salina]PRQ03112.1 Asparagine synthetase 1 [Enhygromyxa salina]